MADLVDLSQDMDDDENSDHGDAPAAAAGPPQDTNSNEFFAWIGRICFPRMLREWNNRDLPIEQFYVTNIEIDMAPVAKPSIRHGPGRGGAIRTYQDNEVVAQMNQVRQLCTAARIEQGVPIIPSGIPVTLTAWMYMRRPNEDFISRRRVEGRLKPEAMTPANTIVPITPDIDNYAKFLLDALTGALYEDDCQVVELHIYKSRDSRGLCNGGMKIQCSRIPEAMLEHFND